MKSEKRSLKRARFATTERIPAYGGFQFDVDQLEQIAEHYRTNGTNFTYNHDPSTRYDMVIIDAGVEDLENGERAGWIEFLIPDHQWADIQSKFDAAGAPGGISITIREPLATLGVGDQEISISGDAVAWSRDSLISLGESMASAATVNVSHIYQFAFDPNALAAIQALSSIPLNLLSSYLFSIFDLTPKRPVFLQVKLLRGDRPLQLVMKASSKDLIKEAMNRLPEWLEGPEDSITLEG